MFIQLDPWVPELKGVLSEVRTEVAGDGVSETRVIGPIVIAVKKELAGSQEDRCDDLIRVQRYFHQFNTCRLLQMTTMEERTAAFNLVSKKEISQLTSGIGPHNDTVLSLLCARRIKVSTNFCGKFTLYCLKCLLQLFSNLRTKNGHYFGTLSKSRR